MSSPNSRVSTHPFAQSCSSSSHMRRMGRPSFLSFASLCIIATTAMTTQAFDVRQHLSTVTRYHVSKDILGNGGASRDPPEGCSAIHLNLVARHGTRAPTKKRIKELDRLAIRLSSLLSEAKGGTHGSTDSVEKIPAWVRGWQSPWKGRDRGGELISIGEEELYDLGNRIRERFSELFNEEYHPHTFPIKATQVPRASASAVAFGMGLLSGKGTLGPQKHRAFSVVSESRASDMCLRFYDTCQTYKDYRLSQEPVVEKLKEPILSEISWALRSRYFLNFTTTDVASLWFLCKQEASLLNIVDQACALFNHTEVIYELSNREIRKNVKCTLLFGLHSQKRTNCVNVSMRDHLLNTICSDIMLVNMKEREEQYVFLWEIIDKRWDRQMHKPLHAAALYLNPSLYYDYERIESNAEIKGGLFQVIDVIVRSSEEKEKVTSQLGLYRSASGGFGLDLAIKARKSYAPAEWWVSFGYDCPSLQTFAIRVLSLTCSASPCERNWSSFEQVLLLEWTDDLEIFILKGYGKSINYRMGVPLLRDIIHSMEQAIIAKENMSTGAFEKAQLRFAHAETVVPFTCLLGLFLEQSEIKKIQSEQPFQLPPKPPLHRSWKGSIVAPFAGNNMLVLYHCPTEKSNSVAYGVNSNYVIQILHNEVPIKLPEKIVLPHLKHNFESLCNPIVTTESYIVPSKLLRAISRLFQWIFVAGNEKSDTDGHKREL